MQIESGLQRWLKVPFVYNRFQDLIGGNAMRRRFIRDDVRAKPGDKVIDIGCGPAQILPWLPDVDYLGLDLSAIVHQRRATRIWEQGNLRCRGYANCVAG